MLFPLKSFIMILTLAYSSCLILPLLIPSQINYTTFLTLFQNFHFSVFEFFLKLEKFYILVKSHKSQESLEVLKNGLLIMDFIIY